MMAEKTNFDREVSKISGLQEEIQSNASILTQINPKIEDLKKKLEQKQSQIMDVGGSQYRELKRELEELSKRVQDTER